MKTCWSGLPSMLNDKHVMMMEILCVIYNRTLLLCHNKMVEERCVILLFFTVKTE